MSLRDQRRLYMLWINPPTDLHYTGKSHTFLAAHETYLKESENLLLLFSIYVSFLKQQEVWNESISWSDMPGIQREGSYQRTCLWALSSLAAALDSPQAKSNYTVCWNVFAIYAMLSPLMERET